MLLSQNQNQVLHLDLDLLMKVLNLKPPVIE